MKGLPVDGLPGFDVARHARELFPLIPVVYNDSVDYDRARGAGTLRISFAGSMAEMEEAVRRLKAWRRT
jgi:aspartate/methionine/tyrosine aminotransferase